MRINKYIALCGKASRREAEKYIQERRISVNDVIIDDLGHQINEEKDIVKIDGILIKPQKTTTTIMFHKPAGCVCTKKDPQKRPTVYDYFPPGYKHLNYVGRLDLQSRGLLLFTDDGELLYRLTHPSFEIPRTYNVWTTKPLSDSAAQKLVDGIDIKNSNDSNANEEIAFATDVYLENGFTEITLIEGKNREIRRMMERLGYEIRDLKRIRYSTIQLGTLKSGEYRELTKEELISLKKAVHLV